MTNSVINENRVVRYFLYGCFRKKRRSTCIDLCIQTAYSLIASIIQREREREREYRRVISTAVAV